MQGEDMRYWCCVVLLLPALLIAQEKGVTMAEDSGGTWLEVSRVIAGGAAEKAGITPGDVLVSYDGRPAGSIVELNALKGQVKTESIDVVFRRGEKTISARLARGPLGVYFSKYAYDITPDPDAKIIPGIAALNWSTGKENSFMAALEAVLQHLGGNDDYPFLCGVSGASFRLHFHDTWCPSSIDPSCGYDATQQALLVTGLTCQYYEVSSDGKNKPQIVKAIMAAIDSGMPVLAIDLIQTPEWGIITGYQKNGQELFCRTYFDGRKGYELAKKFPFVVLVPKRLQKTTDRLKDYRLSFRIPVENLTTETYGAYYSGLAALDRWISRLKTAEVAGLDSAQFETAVFANSVILGRVISDRRVGVD
jgi:hypothetical protein